MPPFHCYPAGMKRDLWNPDDVRVDMPWNSDFKLTMGVIIKKRGKDYEFKKGALEPDVFYAGLEDEIARVNKKMGV